MNVYGTILLIFFLATPSISYNASASSTTNTHQFDAELDRCFFCFENKAQESFVSLHNPNQKEINPAELIHKICKDCIDEWLCYQDTPAICPFCLKESSLSYDSESLILEIETLDQVIEIITGLASLSRVEKIRKLIAISCFTNNYLKEHATHHEQQIHVLETLIRISSCLLEENCRSGYQTIISSCSFILSGLKHYNSLQQNFYIEKSIYFVGELLLVKRYLPKNLPQILEIIHSASFSINPDVLLIIKEVVKLLINLRCEIIQELALIIVIKKMESRIDADQAFVLELLQILIESGAPGAINFINTSQGQTVIKNNDNDKLHIKLLKQKLIRSLARDHEVSWVSNFCRIA